MDKSIVRNSGSEYDGRVHNKSGTVTEEAREAFEDASAQILGVTACHADSDANADAAPTDVSGTDTKADADDNDSTGSVADNVN